MEIQEFEKDQVAISLLRKDWTCARNHIYISLQDAQILWATAGLDTALYGASKEF